MIIDEKVKNKLLKWIDTEPIYKQFEKKCATLSKISGVIINPNEYQLQYNLHASSMDSYISFQTELYENLYGKYPNLQFGMAGRLKSPFSHYEKVIRKFVDLFEKDRYETVEILDDYAIKIFIMSVNYPITKVDTDSKGIYVDSDTDEFRISDNDVFEFKFGKKIINVPVKENKSNIFISNGIPYITTIIDKEITLPLKEAVTYKRSNKEDLVDYCYDFQKDVEQFYNSKGFQTKKRKDYISRPKPSGYSSRQCSFYSEEEGLGIECQIRTYDMERYSNEERKYGYKPDEKKISQNSLNKISRFTLTTKFPDGVVYTYPMTDAECFKYIFGVPLQDYRKQMKPTLKFKKEMKDERNDDGSR